MLHVDIPSRADLEGLMRDRGSVRVSLFLPTTPLSRDAQADRIALKNLAGEALTQLAGHDKREVAAIEELLFDLVDDDQFWDFQANSLAVFVTPTSVRTFRLPSHLRAAAEVSDRFHLKPLLRVMSVPQHAFVLALSQNDVRVIEVSADMPAFAVKVDDMPKDAASAARKASLKGRSPSGRIQGSEGMKVRLAQYARRIDHALRDLLGGRETPLILAAAEPLLSIYREVQSYPHLAAAAIGTNPETTSDADLAASARTIVDESFHAEIAALQALFAQRANEGRTTQDMAQAARAATFGAIQTLLVDIDEVVPGTIDDVGGVTFASGTSASNYGVTDEIAQRALASGARVLGVRAADIPGGGNLAAILRYPV